ncbi:hypothetical protein ACFPM0_31530 [Pseudonocardia sulfidoxydans]|uniref:hypothetical protein n=1 Tax=Pseudonocardia sulfidoxydans TaxID=54011 RepID=UPI00361CF9D4
MPLRRLAPPPGSTPPRIGRSRKRPGGPRASKNPRATSLLSRAARAAVRLRAGCVARRLVTGCRLRRGRAPTW